MKKLLAILCILVVATVVWPGSETTDPPSPSASFSRPVRDESVPAIKVEIELVATTFDPCSDILDLHAGTGSADRQHWFNHLTYQDYARYWIACVHGWGEAQWNCLVALWNHESGWDPTQPNLAGSGAYGIPQALPGSKMASHGDDWRTNGRTQVRWGTRYIDDRYGSPTGTGCRGPY